MKYANTVINNGVEVVLVTLPLEMVPAFDPDQPPPQAYAVADEVSPGWIKQPDGTFRAPTPADLPAQPVPRRVTEYQAKSALMQTPHASGKDCYSVVEAYMASPQTTPQLKLAWATCRDYERLDDKIYLIARSVLAIPESELETWLDDMFIKAKAIH